MQPGLPLVNRFLEEVTITSDGCWMWSGHRDTGGYGLFRLAGRMLIAHTVAYELWVGPVPKGLVLDHIVCDTRACVNYEHLKPVTHQENILRGNGLAAQNARKTHCIRNHELIGDNVRSYNGHRHCRACSVDRQRQDRRRRGVPVRTIGPRSQKLTGA